MWFPLSLAAAVLYSSVWLLARLSKGIPSSMVTALQFVFGPLVLVSLIGTTPLPWSEPIWYWYLLVTFLGVPPLSIALNYASQRIEVTLINPLSGLSSLTAVLLPMLAFQQKLPLTGLIGIGIGTLGLLILYHAKWHVWKTPYPWIALCAVLMWGVNAAVVAETLSVFPHPILLVGISHSAIFLFALLSSLRHWRRVEWTESRIFLMLALMSVTFLQEFATNLSLSLAPASYAISVKRTSIIIASIASYFLLHERSIKLPRLVMSTCLVAAGVVMLLR